MSDQDAARALADEILSGLGIYNLSNERRRIIVQHIAAALRVERQQAEQEREVVQAGLEAMTRCNHDNFEAYQRVMQERDRLRTAAARYQWLRSHAQFDGSGKGRLHWYVPRYYDNATPQEQLDRSIDEEIKAHQALSPKPVKESP